MNEGRERPICKYRKGVVGGSAVTDAVGNAAAAVGRSPVAALGGGFRGAPDSGSANPKRNVPAGRSAGNSVNGKTQHTPGPASKTLNTNRAQKGASDPVRLYNKYGSLDDMELDLGSAPTQRKGTVKLNR